MVVVTNLPPPTHGIRHEQPSTVAVINKRDIGKGTLYIAESHLSWVNGSSGQGFSLEYPHISVHAVSRDPAAYPEECLYILLDADIDFNNPDRQQANTSQDNDDGGGDEEENNITELRFVPEDKSCLDTMFAAMSDCQVLHPDSQDSFGSEDGDGNDDEDDDGDEGFDDFGDSPQEEKHRNGDTEMDVDEGQFEDAPDE